MSTVAKRQARALRAVGGPFAILYQPRAEPKKTGPKPKYDQSYKAKVIAELQDITPSAFCTPIGTQLDAGKTARIKGRS